MGAFDDLPTIAQPPRALAVVPSGGAGLFDDLPDAKVSPVENPFQASAQAPHGASASWEPNPPINIGSDLGSGMVAGGRMASLGTGIEQAVGPSGATGAWREDPGMFSSVERGYEQGRQAITASSAAFLGRNPDEAAQTIARRQGDAGLRPEGYENFLKAPSVEAFSKDPAGIIGGFLGEAAGQMAAPIGSALAGGIAGGIGGGGGGAAVGAAGGMFVGSLGLNAGQKIVSMFEENGIDLSKPDQVAAAFRDPQLMREVRTKALQRGIPLAVFDTAAQGVAGRLYGPAARAVGTLSGGGTRLAPKLAGVTAEALAQGGLGAAGEATGEVASGEPFSPASVMMAGGSQALLTPAEYGVRAVGGAVGKAGKELRDNSTYRTPPQGRDRVEPTFRPDQGPQMVNSGDPFADVPQAAPEAPVPPQTATPAQPTAPEGQGGIFADLPDATAPKPSPTGGAIQTGPESVTLPPIVVKPEATAAAGETRGGSPPSSHSYDVVTPRGRRVPVQDEIVEADSLVPSHTSDMTPNPAYPAELQPRDRGRAASKEQVARIAGNLTPELLGPGVSATEGAPIIGPDGIVESGNARTLAIQQAYRSNLPGAAKYREALKAQGFDLSGFRNPVLVRRRTGDMSPEDRAAFTREANERSTLAMSATEQAQADAKGLPAHILDHYQGGDIASAANRDFVRKFIDTVAPADRASLIGEHGELSQEGIRRIEAATFAKAYEAPDVLSALREDQDSNIRAIGNAMVDAAPAWARMRADAADGTIRPEVDATPDLLAAVRLVRQSRQQGKPLIDLVNQRDAFAPEITPATRAFLDLMYRDREFRRPASGKAVSDALRFYTEEAGRKTTATGLFADEPSHAPADILKAALRRRDGGLFGNDELTPGIAAEARRPGREPGPAPVTRMVERGRSAVDEVLQSQESKSAAMVRDDVGAITFDWGKPGNPARDFEGGWGLSHIIAKRDGEGGHGLEFVRQRVPEVLAYGRLDRMRGPHNARRAEIVHGGDRIVLSLHRYGDRESWVISGYRDRKGSGDEGTVNARDAYAQRPSGVQGAVGAEPSPKVGTEPEGGNPFDDLVPPQEARGPGNGPGRKYLGFVKDQAGGVSLKDPIRRENILRKFVKGMGAPLYQGRIQGKRTLGFYRPKLEEVRIKHANDIETTAHEMAHLLDDRVPEVRAQWLPASNANKTIREELKGISYDESKLYEGFAEFVRHWMTQPAEAQARAPEFFKWFEDFANRSPYGPTLREAQKGMTDWFAQDALTRARSKIGPVRQSINSALTGVWDQLRQGVLDDLHGIERMERGVAGKVQPGGAYQTARLTRGKAAMIDGAMRYGAPVIQTDGSIKFEGKGLEAILKPVTGDLDNFLLYAVGRSSSELMAQGREHLFTKTEIAAMRGLETPEFRQAFNDYQVWNRKILDFAQKKGVIDPSGRRKWQRLQYLPFYRVGEAGGGRGFQQVNGAFNGIKALTGGTENIRDVLHNMVANAAMLIDAALTNEVRQGIARMAGLQGGAHFLAKIPTEERIIKVHAEEVRARILEALGVRQMWQLTPDQQIMIDDIIDGMAPLAEFTLRGQAPTGRDIMAVLHGGKPIYYEVADRVLMRSLMSLNRPAQHWLVKMLSYPKRIGQLSVTLSPDFMVANFARDTVMGGIMSKNGFRPIIDSAKGMKSRITADANYREFLANGGGMSGQLLDETKFRVHLERFYGRKGIDFRTVLDSPMKLLHGVEQIADAVEMSTRLGEYQRARGKGLSPKEAAFQAREVSTDFAMRGDWGPVNIAYDTVIFLKAATVSLDRAYRGFVQDSNHWDIAAKTALLATASAGLAAINFGNPLYDQLEDWDRDSHWHFFIPTAETFKAWHDGTPLPAIEDRYTHLRFPKLWEIGVIASLAERGMERTLSHEPGKLPGDAGRLVMNNFNMGYLPQAISPLWEQATNRLQFLDRPIVTEGMKERMPFAQYSEYTSPTVRKVGEVTGLSPVRVEALLKGYLNTWATYGLMVSDGLFFDKAPDMRADQYPVLRRFYEQEPSIHSRYVTELYDTLKDATEARRTMSFLAKSYGPEDRVEEIANSKANMGYRQMTFANKRMQIFSKEMALATDANSLDEVRRMVDAHAKLNRDPKFLQRAQLSKDWNDSGGLKRYLLDQLIKERNEFAKSVMDTVEEPPRKASGAR